GDIVFTSVNLNCDDGNFNFYSNPRLTAETTYYYRAYATNSEGTSYGGVESFTTSAGAPSGGTQTINFDESDGDGGTIIFAGDTDFGGEENYVEYGISGKTLVAESSGDDPVSFEDLSKYTSEAQEVKALKNVIAMYPDDYESTNEELIVYFKDNSEFDLKELTLYAFLSNPDHKAY